jgi:hypothetical protein
MVDHEAWGEYFGIDDVVQLLMFPTLSVVDFAACTSEILGLVDNDFEVYRVDLPLVHFDVRAFLESFGSELAGVVVDGVSNRSGSDDLGEFGVGQSQASLAVADQKCLDVLRQLLFF